MTKIIEKIIEPDKIYKGSIFKLKIKVIRYMTCREMKELSCKQAKIYKCKEIKGI